MVLLGVGAALLNILGVIPYVRGILRGKTKPERSAWWIWTLLMVVAFGAQVSIGATWSLPLTLSYLACNIVIALLSISHGYGKFRMYDFAAICFAIVGIVVWRQTGQPVLALLIIIAIDFTGNLLTMKKTWRAPYSENLITWVTGGLAALLSAIAVGSWSPAKLLFPVYAVLVNLLMVWLLDYRRKWRRQRIRARLHKNIRVVIK